MRSCELHFDLLLKQYIIDMCIHQMFPVVVVIDVRVSIGVLACEVRVMQCDVVLTLCACMLLSLPLSKNPIV